MERKTHKESTTGRFEFVKILISIKGNKPKVKIQTANVNIFATYITGVCNRYLKSSSNKWRKNINLLIEKWTMNVNRQFRDEELERTDKHIKSCST